MKFSFFKSTIQIFLFIAMFFSCNNNTENYTAFNKLISDNSGIDFSNDLIENDSLNYFTYAYIYMGGGISAGDINNDGLIDLYFTGNMVSNKLYLSYIKSSKLIKTMF